MLKVLEGGQVVEVKVSHLALEAKIERGPGRHKKTAFPASARKGVFIPNGIPMPEALRLLELADEAKAAPPPAAKVRPRQPRQQADPALKLAKLRLAPLAAPLDKPLN